MIGDELDKEVRDYLMSMRSHSAVVNTTIVVSRAKEII